MSTMPLGTRMAHGMAHAGPCGFRNAIVVTFCGAWRRGRARVGRGRWVAGVGRRQRKAHGQ